MEHPSTSNTTPVLHLLPTVLAAYVSLAANAGAFLWVALVWSLASTAASAVAFVWSESAAPTQMSEDILLSIAPFFLAVFVSVAGSLCISTIWHRFVILGEPVRQLFPTTADVIAPYFVRSTGAMTLPIALYVLTAWAYALDSDSVVLLAVVYFGAPIILAATARLLLVLPASAVGDKQTTARASWRITRGCATRLLLGLLACDLPLSGLNFGLDYLTRDYAENSVAELVASTAGGVLDFARNVTWTAFMSFAYLQLVRPGEAQARHFA